MDPVKDSVKDDVKEPAALEMSELKSDKDVPNGNVQAEDNGGSITFHNISYTVEQRMCFKKRPPKVILDDVR